MCHFSSYRIGNSPSHGEVFPAFLSLSWKEKKKQKQNWGETMWFQSARCEDFSTISVHHNGRNTYLVPPCPMLRNSFPCHHEVCVNVWMKKERWYLRGSQLQLHSEGVFPCSCSHRNGPCQIYTVNMKSGYFRSRAHHFARSLIKKNTLPPPTTHLCRSRGCYWPIKISFYKHVM